MKAVAAEPGAKPQLRGRHAGSAPAPVWRQADATVVRQRQVGAGHRWLELRMPRGFPVPVSGQFVQLLLAAPSPVFLPRPMSVADVRKDAGGIALGFLYEPVGAGTQALSALGAGDRVGVLGPLGRGFPRDVPGTPLLVAGGRGVAPLLFAAAELAREGRRCEFLFGARDAGHLVALAEARQRLATMGGRLHLATDDGSRGLRGNVVDLLERVAKSVTGPRVIHACGPHAMLNAVARWGLWNEVPAFLAMESVMACGTGVCRGCPLPRSESARTRLARHRDRIPSLYGSPEFAMCCTDGPVFAAEDLDWDQVT